VAGGIVQERICATLGISLKTLRKHFKDAIQVGQAQIDALAVSVLLAAMNGGGKEAVTAAIWWQKARMGWVARTTSDEGKSADTATRIVVELVG
jgi:hypothetical protein